MVREYYSLIGYSPDTKEGFNVIQYYRHEGIYTYLNREYDHMNNERSIYDILQNLNKAIDDQIANQGLVAIETEKYRTEFWGDINPKSFSSNGQYRQLFKKTYPRGIKYCITPGVKNVDPSALNRLVKSVPSSQELYSNLYKNYRFYNTKTNNLITFGAYFPDTKETLLVEVKKDRLVFYENRNNYSNNYQTNNSIRDFLDWDYGQATLLKGDKSRWRFQPDLTRPKGVEKIDARKALDDIKNREFHIVLTFDMVSKPLSYNNSDRNKVGLPHPGILELSILLENLFLKEAA